MHRVSRVCGVGMNLCLKSQLSLAWGLMPIVPTPRKLRQRIEFEAMLGYIVRLCLK